jgi:hypothetical protein
MTRVITVDAVGELMASRTRIVLLETIGVDRHSILGGNNLINLEVWQFEWNTGDGLALPCLKGPVAIFSPALLHDNCG